MTKNYRKREIAIEFDDVFLLFLLENNMYLNYSNHKSSYVVVKV